ncbi:MAG: DUF1820 family protein [Gammaproteobacteria bacterium]|jgi:hypothetical protein|nr:DUF1820 family protein [Gammaproteobacteria bacterium]
MNKQQIYKVIFLNQGKVYELFADSVGNCDLYGFIEVAGLAFDEHRDATDSVVIDPTEERMREEFAGANALYLPLHSVLRIDQVNKRGQCKIREREPGEKVTQLPISRR